MYIKVEAETQMIGEVGIFYVSETWPAKPV